MIGWRRTVAGPALLGVVLLLAILGALLIAERLLGAPRADVDQLALFLTVSGVGSIVVGAIVVGWASNRLGSLRLRLTLAFGVGLLIAVANVLMTSALMFLSPHDLSLLFLLLAFAAVISLTFGVTVASTLTAELEVLSDAAARLARGHLDVRVHPRGTDEIARLGFAFDHMAGQLQAAFDRQLVLEAGRRELVAAVSHDLRTPLSTTRALVEALSDGVVTEPAEVRRYLGLVHREIQHLTRLIDDLFELSQIESGALQLHLSRIDAHELASETLAVYEAQAREQDVALRCAVAEGLPLLNADAARLQRVLRNLIDNALRHTPPGGQIEISARAETDVLVLGVSDSGPGIPADERERVFERFYRGERSRNRGEHPAGAGLGLAIARGLVEAHGGRIWLEELDEGGASFTFAIPIGESTPN